MSNRDWIKIKNELSSLAPSVLKGDKKMSQNHDVIFKTDEQALLAHIADALGQEKRP